MYSRRIYGKIAVQTMLLSKHATKCKNVFESAWFILTTYVFKFTYEEDRLLIGVLHWKKSHQTMIGNYRKEEDIFVL